MRLLGKTGWGVLAALVASVALAATLTGAWTPPTANTDGSTIAAPITYNTYIGASGAEVLVGAGLTTASTTASVAAGATACLQVTAVVNGVESARTTEVCKTEPFPTPNAPTNVTWK